ncbi:nucleotidyl transferase AbiEii/AbiGii toxin family protein [Rhodococcus spelaei]|uniref:Nucleotidyl transferase AbiEii/AbiGii toxin family protein n=1 Tax=Rhodococcus spelaei TaxID=2546320 RepID=A0A541AZ16_9NOCA|nr:nucleotidyl transferase AbiEii/AbiGii toxin family protein [Rhodococcus spelaei]TQF65313.1 nucleotidyl transferase AbiEii/AbiGii toxin family protein [Rhodococcus spelaei]
MTTDRPPHSSNPAAFARSLKDRIRNETTRRGRTTEQLRREFFLQRFLARVFSEPGDRWLLKGGASLLVRRPDARYSQDIDLLHTSAAVTDALTELAAIAEAGSELDPFRFVFDPPRLMTGGVAGASVKVRVYLGAVQLADFPIDLSTELVPVGEVDYHLPRPVVSMDELAPLPKFALYPLPQQVSDKVCAMYERYGDLRQPSTRYHDLVDLTLIVTAWPLDAAVTRTALQRESARRALTLPTEMTRPAASWTAGYAKIARTVPGLPEHTRRIDGALRIVGDCLDPLLGGHLDTGSWDPIEASWSHSATS